jgi:AraC family transcriptional activator of pobA
MSSQIQKYQFKEGLEHEFEIVDLKQVFQHKKDMMSVPHRAQFYHIIWIKKGKGIHFVDFNPIKVVDNMLIFIPQNSVNRFDPDGEYEGKTIIFTDEFFCKNESDIQYLRSTMLFSDLYDIATINVQCEDKELSKTLEIMENEFLRSKDNVQSNILHNLLHVFLLQAEREIRKQGFKELKSGINLNYLIQFKDFLEENFKEIKSVNQYADKLSISEKQLHKATTSLIDKTPKQVIDERILLEAKRLLAHSNLSIKEIAYDLGYEEPTNFIKYFKKHAESTPSEFRELIHN